MEKEESVYKTIFAEQGGKCKECGREIGGLPHARFLIAPSKKWLPVAAVCNSCALRKQEKDEELIKELGREARKKSREHWLDPQHRDYETRLRCANEGHRIVGSYQGFSGGGCWCGYYSPEEKPLRTNEGELW